VRHTSVACGCSWSAFSRKSRIGLHAFRMNHFHDAKRPDFGRSAQNFLFGSRTLLLCGSPDALRQRVRHPLPRVKSNLSTRNYFSVASKPIAYDTLYSKCQNRRMKSRVSQCLRRGQSAWFTGYNCVNVIVGLSTGKLQCSPARLTGSLPAYVRVIPLIQVIAVELR
jgi:hypothetical protein